MEAIRDYLNVFIFPGFCSALSLEGLNSFLAISRTPEVYLLLTLFFYLTCFSSLLLSLTITVRSDIKVNLLSDET